MQPRSNPVRVYISYRRSDGYELAAWLYDELRKHGVDVWFDVSDLQPGQDWAADLERAIQESDAVLALLSRGETGGGVADDHVMALRFAKPCFPILVQRDAPVPSYFRSLMHVDLSDPGKRTEPFERLLAQIFRLASPSKQEPRYENENGPPLSSEPEPEPEPTPIPTALPLAYRAVLGRLVKPDLLRDLETFPWAAVLEKHSLAELEQILPLKQPQPLWEAWIRATKPVEVAALEKALGAVIQSKRIPR